MRRGGFAGRKGPGVYVANRGAFSRTARAKHGHLLSD